MIINYSITTMPIICNVSLLYLFLRLFFFAADSSFCFQCHSSLVHLNETHPVCRALKRSNLEIKKWFNNFCYIHVKKTIKICIMYITTIKNTEITYFNTLYVIVYTWNGDILTHTHT